MSVPNQKVLIITKPQTTMPPFLQISADDWQTAFKELSPSAFGVYLHLAQMRMDINMNIVQLLLRILV